MLMVLCVVLELDIRTAIGVLTVYFLLVELHGNGCDLYVNTGGLAKDARAEMVHAAKSVQLVGLDTFPSFLRRQLYPYGFKTRGI